LGYHPHQGVYLLQSRPPQLSPNRSDGYHRFLAQHLCRHHHHHRRLRRFLSQRRTGLTSLIIHQILSSGRSTAAPTRECYLLCLGLNSLQCTSGRRLPALPTNGTNGHSSPYAVQKGLPAEPRLPRQLPSTSRPSTAKSTVGDVPMIHMPSPDNGSGVDWNSPSEYSSSTVSRQPSAKSVPRSTHNGYDDAPSRSPSSLDDMYASPESYMPPVSSPESVLSGYHSPEHILLNQPSQQRLSSLYASSGCSYLTSLHFPSII
jgi:hypothetical protein